MIALALLAACTGSGELATSTLPEAAQEVTFASLAALGSFQLQAAVEREVQNGSASPQTSQETLEIRWRDADHWSYRHGRDGRVVREIVVWEAVAWAGDGDGPLDRKGDAEPYRVQLATVWDPWQWGLESLADAVVFDQGELELRDGRRLRRHQLSLPPELPEPEAAEGAKISKRPKPPRRGWKASAVTGTVWIDEATAVRLDGKVAAEAVSGDRRQRTELLFAVGSIGGDPGVAPPPGDKR